MATELRPARRSVVWHQLGAVCSGPATALRRRPLVCAAACFAAGVMIGEWLWSAGILMAVALACLVWCLVPGVHGILRRAIMVRCAFGFGFAAAGALRMQVQAIPGPCDISRWIGPEFVTVTGRLASEPEARRDLRFLMSAQAIRPASGVSEPCAGLLQCSIVPVTGRRAPRYGDIVSISGMIESPQPPQAPGAPPTDAQLRRHGIFATMTARYPSLWRIESTPSRFDPVRLALAWRDSMLRQFEHRMDRSTAGLATGIVLGGRQSIAPDDVDAFTRSGLIHIVAASGANVAILLGATLLVAHRANLARRWEAIVCSAVVIAYAVAAGSEPSVVRAAVMSVMYMAAPLLDRDRDAPCALAAAALASLAWAPGNLWDVGFQLSFVIVAAMLAVWPIWAAAIGSLWPPMRPAASSFSERLRRTLAMGTLSAVGVSAVAGLAAAPLTAQTFSAVPTLGIVSNTLAAPAVAFLLPTALVAWLACLVVPPVGDVIAQHLVGPMARYVGSVARWVSGIPGSALHTSPPGWLGVWSCYLALAAVVAIIARRTAE